MALHSDITTGLNEAIEHEKGNLKAKVTVKETDFITIYQLHEYGGEYEDSFDRIVGSFANKKRAEEEKRKREEKEASEIALHKKCVACPLFSAWEVPEKTFECLEKMCKEHCEHFKKIPDKDDNLGSFDCGNYHYHYEDREYRIEEIKVENNGRFIDVDEACDKSELYDQCVLSIDSNGKPVWSEERLERLFDDFILIPKKQNQGEVKYD